VAALPGRCRCAHRRHDSVEHHEDAVEALEIDLSKSDLEYVDETDSPVEIDRHE
jgi:hypothetical protein